MIKDYNVTVETISRIWIEESGECYEVKQDDDGLNLVQINYYSEGVYSKAPDTTMVLMPEVAEQLWCVLRDQTMRIRDISGDYSNG